MISEWLYFGLFILGLCLGSFINVVALRYQPEKNFLGGFSGRSHCPHCKKTLRWSELVPILSFILQKGRCRSCKQGLSFQYPIIEILSGLILVLVPRKIIGFALAAGVNSAGAALLSIIWILAFLILLLIALIDLRLRIIPDGLNLSLAILGLAGALTHYYFFGFGLIDGVVRGSFFGHYAMIFWFGESLGINVLAGVLFGGLFFGGLYVLTRGNGIGFGDVKLGAALGLLFSWPDIVLVSMLAFIIGAIISVGLILSRKKTIKDALPFAPFAAVAAGIVFFGGFNIINAYFNAFKLF